MLGVQSVLWAANEERLGSTGRVVDVPCFPFFFFFFGKNGIVYSSI